MDGFPSPPMAVIPPPPVVAHTAAVAGVGAPAPCLQVVATAVVVSATLTAVVAFCSCYFLGDTCCLVGCCFCFFCCCFGSFSVDLAAPGHPAVVADLSPCFPSLLLQSTHQDHCGFWVYPPLVTSSPILMYRVEAVVPDFSFVT